MHSLRSAVSFRAKSPVHACAGACSGLQSAMREFEPISVRRLTFWPLHLTGWFFYIALALFSYGPYLETGLDRVSETASLFLAFFASFALRVLCRWLWKKAASISMCIIASLSAAYLLASAISVLLGSARLPFNHETITLAAVSAGSFCNAIALGTWCAFYFGIKHYLASEERYARLQASEITAREAQAQALQYQLQPHFLFNTLNAISSLVVNGEAQGATQMISRLADLLRNTLEAQSSFVSLTEELNLIEQYLAIERARFERRLTVTVDVDSAASRALLPRWLLQPLVENAVRHGIAPLPEGGEILIRARTGDTSLMLTIDNDFKSAAEPSRSNGLGVGLPNARARLERLYGSSGSLSVTATEEGRHRVTIRLPLTSSAHNLEIASLEPIQ